MVIKYLIVVSVLLMFLETETLNASHESRERHPTQGGMMDGLTRKWNKSLNSHKLEPKGENSGFLDQIGNSIIDQIGKYKF